MAKRRHGRGNSRFFLGMGIYAVVFLALLIGGLIYFWYYLDAYEKTRVEYTLDAYMDELSPEYICNRSTQVIGLRDPRIQTEAEARSEICQALSGELQYIKNLKDSSEKESVYFLRLGSRNIGTVTLQETGESRFGFTKWEVKGETFDLSYLLSEPYDAVVPEPFQVLINGKVLSSEMIVEEGIPYTELSALSDDRRFPTKVRYEAGPVVGNWQLTVADAYGKPVDAREADAVFLENCTDEEKAELNNIIDRFIRAYVQYTTRAGGDTEVNLGRISQYVVPGSALYARLWGSAGDLIWLSDRYATVNTIDVSFYTRVSDGCYVCDVTYTVSSNTLAGRIETTDTTKILFVRTAYGLRAEAMS